jgi:hypothetical protein
MSTRSLPESSLNDDQRFGAVRELAYAGRYDEAMAVLAAMREGETSPRDDLPRLPPAPDRPVEEGIVPMNAPSHWTPPTILARSYYGQLLVQMDELALAGDQLTQIRAHGGSGTWAERALSTAIETGVTYTF